MTEITVRGCYSTSRSPERATVHATISYEGPAMEPVYERVAGDLETLKASISPMLDSDSGAITRWSADQLRMWSNRPWNNHGSRLPLVYHASIGVNVEFSDFSALSAWIGDQVAAEGFAVSTIEWTLIPTHREELQREVRNRAVQDAVTRAQQYADALGLGAIRPVAVADAGMLPDTSGSADEPRVRQVRTAAALAAGSGPDMEMMPKDIELSVAVDARFVAGR